MQVVSGVGLDQVDYMLRMRVDLEWKGLTLGLRDFMGWNAFFGP